MTTLATLRAFVLSAVPTANRFAALSITSGVTFALIATFAPLVGKLPRLSIKPGFAALVVLLLLAAPAFAHTPAAASAIDAGAREPLRVLLALAFLLLAGLATSMAWRARRC